MQVFKILIQDGATETILEGFCKSKLQESVQLHTVLAMYKQENVQNNEQLQNRVERGAVTKSQQGREASVEEKVRECYQCEVIGQCSRGGSCSFSLDASGNRCDQRQKDNRLCTKAQTQTDGKKPSKGSGFRGESPSGKGG